MKIKLLICILSCLLLLPNLMAEKISKIQYVGCKRIEQETIESYLPIQEGDECDSDSINEALKALNATGFFEEVNIDIEGSVLVIKVKEATIVNKISFEGNKKITDKDLNKAIKWRANETFSPAKAKEIQQALLDIYRKMGRYNATVEPKIIRLPNDKVNVVFEINEGNAAGIESIVFIGNESFSSSDLRDVIFSRVKRWYRFFVTDDIYDPDRMEEDKMALARFYHEKGYADARILSTTAELSRDKKKFILTFVIDEGPLYSFGTIDVKSHILQLDKKDLVSDFYCKKGDKFNSNLIEIDTVQISRKASEHGFSSIKVDPEFSKDAKAKTVGMTFHVNEGDRIYVSKIIIKGNTRTREHIIRREIDIEEGDAYNQNMITMAENSLRRLGYFKTVHIEAIKDPNSLDKCNLQVTVVEDSTGEAMAAATYSSQEGVGVDLSYSERNFLGTGKALSIFLGSGKTMTGRSYEVDPSTGKDRAIMRKSKFKFLYNVNVSVSDPHIFDKDIEGTVGGFRHQSGRWEAFSTSEIGGSVGISYNLTSKIDQSWEYTMNARKFADVSPNTSPIIKYQTMKKEGESISITRPGRSSVSSIKHVISYGTSFFTGWKGSLRSGLATTVAGLGGDAKHLKNEIFNTYVIPINRKTNIKFGLSFGMLSKIGSKKPNIADSFALGLDSFRGFDDCGFGPMAETTRQIATKDALGITKYRAVTYRDYIGARKYWKGSAEITFPIGMPEELQFRGFVFTDFGTLWDPPEKGEKFLKKQDKKLLIDKDRFPRAVTASEADAKQEDGTITTDFITCDFDKEDAGGVISHKILDSKKIRASIGFGISFVTPMGPMQLSYAMPIRKEKHDIQYRFLFGFKTTF